MKPVRGFGTTAELTGALDDIVEFGAILDPLDHQAGLIVKPAVAQEGGAERVLDSADDDQFFRA